MVKQHTLVFSQDVKAGSEIMWGGSIKKILRTSMNVNGKVVWNMSDNTTQELRVNIEIVVPTS